MPSVALTAPTREQASLIHYKQSRYKHYNDHITATMFAPAIDVSYVVIALLEVLVAVSRQSYEECRAPTHNSSPVQIEANTRCIYHTLLCFR